MALSKTPVLYKVKKKRKIIKAIIANAVIIFFLLVFLSGVIIKSYLSEIAQKLSELNSNILLNSFKKVDNFCLRAIDEVVVNSDEMKKYLTNVRKIDGEKILRPTVMNDSLFVVKDNSIIKLN